MQCPLFHIMLWQSCMSDWKDDWRLQLSWMLLSIFCRWTVTWQWENHRSMSTKSDQREVRCSIIRSAIKVTMHSHISVCVSRQLAKEFCSRGRSACVIEIRFLKTCWVMWFAFFLRVNGKLQWARRWWWNEEKEKGQDCILEGTSRRTGEKISREEVPVFSRERGVGRETEALRHASQNLVPESQNEVQTAVWRSRNGNEITQIPIQHVHALWRNACAFLLQLCPHALQDYG